MYDWVRLFGLIIIPAVALFFLIVYVRATIEQAEAMQKPCIVLDSAARDPANAVILHQTNPGDLALSSHEGLAALRNVGSGSALNVRYVFEKIGETQGTPVRPEGAIQTILPRELVRTHAPATLFPAHKFHCLITYDSLSKSHYETRFIVNDTVLGNFCFRHLRWWTRLSRWYSDWQHRRKMAAFKKVV